MSKTAKKPVGRPRRDGKPHLTREALFEATAELIAVNGYAGTSIRMIATAADTSPASIFNLFASKDELLNAVIAYAASFSFDFYTRINSLDLTADVKLYKSIFAEVEAVASAKPAFTGLFYLPELSHSGFEPAQQVRADMVAHYQDCIDSGMADGLFVEVPAAFTAEQVFQLTETSILARAATSALTLAQQARYAARLCLRGLLLDPRRLTNVEAEADAVSLTFASPAFTGPDGG